MTTPPLETVSVGTKAPLGRSESSPPSLVDQEGGYTAADLKRLLDGRDDFIVSKGLWGEFCDSLSAQALAVMSPRIEQRNE